MPAYSQTTARAVDDADLYPDELPGLVVYETDWHREAAVDLIFMLQERYRDHPDVCVGGNLYLYYQEGDPRKMVSPDVFVAFGVPKRMRRIYKLWEEPGGPSVVFEVTSDKTRRRDVVAKKTVYAELGVAEYFLYDPQWEYLKPPLQGFRLVRGEYVPLQPDATGALTSERLGLKVFLDGWRIDLADARTGEKLPRPAELLAENARLRAELERLRADRSAID